MLGYSSAWVGHVCDHDGGRHGAGYGPNSQVPDL